MELNLVDSDSHKLSLFRRYCWQNILIPMALLLTFNVAAYLAELSEDTVGKSVQECFITMAIKFLNFYIAKSLQFRYLAPWQTLPSFMNLVSWVALTQSVSSLYSP